MPFSLCIFQFCRKILWLWALKFCLPKYGKPLWYLNPLSFVSGVSVWDFFCLIFFGICLFDLGVLLGGFFVVNLLVCIINMV